MADNFAKCTAIASGALLATTSSLILQPAKLFGKSLDWRITLAASTAFAALSHLGPIGYAKVFGDRKSAAEVRRHEASRLTPYFKAGLGLGFAVNAIRILIAQVANRMGHTVPTDPVVAASAMVSGALLLLAFPETMAEVQFFGTETNSALGFVEARI